MCVNSEWVGGPLGSEKQVRDSMDLIKKRRREGVVYVEVSKKDEFMIAEVG